MFDDRSANYALPIPNLLNPLSVDVERLRTTISRIDELIKGNADLIGALNGIASLDSTGKVPTSQLPEMLATGVMLDYALKTLPSAGWRFCDGSALKSDDALAATLRAKLIADSNPYGADANGNPLLPDARGRVVAGKDDMGGTAAGRLSKLGSGIDGVVLGYAGGAETHKLTGAQMPSHIHGVSDPGHGHGVADPGHAHSIADPGHAHGVYDPGHAHSYVYTDLGGRYGGGAAYSDQNSQWYTATTASGTGVSIYGAGTGIGIYAAATGISIAGAGTGISIQATGGDGAHNNVQPTLIANKIIKL